MNKAKQKKLEQRGWKLGSTSEFLGLTAKEARFIELKLALSNVGGACPAKPTRHGPPKEPVSVKRSGTGVI
jgi:hypothetical protein